MVRGLTCSHSATWSTVSSSSTWGLSAALLPGIPAAFNFLILKLHAFEDRKEDVESDLGRHHAYDIFATIIRVTEQNWKNAKEHFAPHKDRPY